jgi:hypothetical protein
VLVYKNNDQSVTSSITPADDAELKFYLPANEIWQFEFFFFWDAANATPDITFTLNGPASPTNIRAHLIGSDSNAQFSGGGSEAIVLTTYGTAVSPTPASAPTSMAWAKGVVENGSNAGYLVLQWAQRASSTTPTFVRRGSYVLARRLSQ